MTDNLKEVWNFNQENIGDDKNNRFKRRNSTINKRSILKVPAPEYSQRKASDISIISGNSSAITENIPKRRKSVIFEDKTINIHYNIKESPVKSIKNPNCRVKYNDKDFLEINLNSYQKSEDVNKTPILNKLIFQFSQNTQNNISIFNSPDILLDCIDKSKLHEKGFSKKNKKPRLQDKLKAIFSQKLEIAREESTRDPNCIGYNNENNQNLKDTMNRRNSIASVASITNNKSLEEMRKEKLIRIVEDPNYPISVLESAGCIYGFSAISFKNTRKTNEDKINIIINIKLDHISNKNNKINYFGLFDGHGGESVAEELNNKLHKFIIENNNIIDNPVNCILEGFHKAEKYILENNQDNSGSCSLIALYINNLCYIANLGDSRGLISTQTASRVNILTIDHKPENIEEKERIISCGGSIYKADNDNDLFREVYRTVPGGLAVSRTIGDAEAKLSMYKGLPGVIVSVPDILSFEINPEIDFVILASDGIYDKLLNKDVILIILRTCLESIKNQKNFKEFLSDVVKNVIKEAILKNSKDNISCIFMAFENMFNIFNNKNENGIKLAIKKVELSEDYKTLYKETINKKFYKHINYSQIHNKTNEKKEQKNILYRCCGLFK